MENNLFRNPQVNELGSQIQGKILKSVALYLGQLREKSGAERLSSLRQIPSGFSLTLPPGIKITVFYEHKITEELTNNTFDFTGVVSNHPDNTTIFNHLNINLGLGEPKGGVSVFDTDIYKRSENHPGGGKAIKIKQGQDSQVPGDIQVTDFSPVGEVPRISPARPTGRSVGGGKVSWKAAVHRRIYINFSKAHYNCLVSESIADSLWLVHSLTVDAEKILNYYLILQNFPYTFGSKLGNVPEEERKININAQIMRLLATSKKDGTRGLTYESDFGPRTINKEIMQLYLARTKLEFLDAQEVLQKILTSQPNLLIDIPSFYQESVEPLLKYFPSSFTSVS